MEELLPPECVLRVDRCSYSHGYALQRKKENKAIKRNMIFAPKEKGGIREIAQRFASELSDGMIGFIHSDVDFTNKRAKSNKAEWQQVYNDLSKGIKAADKWAVCRPTVPLPRTEAWLIRLAPESPAKYSAEQIEQLKGNDSADCKNNAKKILAGWKYVPGNRRSRGSRTFNELVDSCFSTKRLMSLSSFEKFYEDAKELIHGILQG